MATPLIEFQDVTFGYAADAPVLSGVDLCVNQGDFVVVRGPSGSGKSTLVRLICRLEDPDSGRILYRGTPLTDYHPPRLRRELAYVQQTPVTSGGSLRDNLLLPFFFAANADLQPPDDRTLAHRLESLGLEGLLLDRPASGLSVGQKQRLCLARSLGLSPSALLMDEPTSALDPKSAAAVLDTAVRLNLERRMTVVVVTHGERDPDHPSPRFCRVENGKAVFA